MDNPSFNQNGIEYNGEQIAYKDSTYELVSKVAYLIGVPLRIFQNEHEPPKIGYTTGLNRIKMPASFVISVSSAPPLSAIIEK